MKKMQLMPRLRTVADMVSGLTVADIGTDHGKLLIYLLQNGKISHGIGSDVAVGPAGSCKKNAVLFGAAEDLDIRVGDGLKTLVLNEAETIVIAGMGGELILKILEDSLEIAQSAKELILQPMTNIPRLLEGLPKIGFRVQIARLCKEKDKLYRMFKVVKGKEARALKPIDLVLCPQFFEENDPLCGELIKREINKHEQMLSGLLQASAVNESEISALKALIEEMKAYEILRKIK